MENLEIRLIVSAMNLTYKEIASKIGVTRQYLSKCMRYPLKPEMESRIISAIESLRGDRDDAV